MPLINPLEQERVMKLGERFWNKVDKRAPDDCWNWVGAITSAGYGSFWLDGKVQSAHRLMYEVSRGGIGDGLVCHHCDNRACVNPNHLYSGSLSSNILDSYARNRRQPTSGERSGSAKLTRRDVHEIRRLYATGNVTQVLLGTMFCVDHSAIFQIVRRKIWRHI